MTRAGYPVIAMIGLIGVFNLIKFVLIEVPIISYALDPDGTAVGSIGCPGGCGSTRSRRSQLWSASSASYCSSVGVETAPSRSENVIPG